MEIIKFNKCDFLTASQLAQRLGENKELVEKTMHTLYIFRTKINVNNHKTPLITRRPKFKIHPCGIEYFKQYINNQKAR